MSLKFDLSIESHFEMNSTNDYLILLWIFFLIARKESVKRVTRWWNPRASSSEWHVRVGGEGVSRFIPLLVDAAQVIIINKEEKEEERKRE